MADEGQIYKKFSGKINVQLNYLLYLPKDYKSSRKKFPLMIFLHGSGERGNNIELVKKYGPPKFVDKGSDFKFILISPQCPEDTWWSADILKPLIDEILSEFNVDQQKIYVTGLSMGGFGTWDLALKYPNLFAAIAPICGWGNPLEVNKIKHLPVWIFHGARDKIVPVEKSLEMFEALKKAGGDPLLTIYPDKGHDSWTVTYDNPDLYTWFLKQKKKK